MKLSKGRAAEIATSLREATRSSRCSARAGMRAVEVIEESASTIKPLLGLKDSSTKSDKVEKIATVFLTFPADPTGITYVVGGVLFGAGRAMRSVEMKRMGIKDVLRVYRRLSLELREALT